MFSRKDMFHLLGWTLMYTMCNKKCIYTPHAHIVFISKYFGDNEIVCVCRQKHPKPSSSAEFHTHIHDGKSHHDDTTWNLNVKVDLKTHYPHYHFCTKKLLYHKVSEECEICIQLPF
jgi:hypothetical protein